MTLKPRTSHHRGTKTAVQYLVAAIAIPCALFLCTETALRFFHIGYNPRFFCREKSQGSTFCYDNPAFGRRFFPPTLVRRSEKFRFPLHKEKNEKRIFVLGSSAAEGDPAPAFAFSSDLDCMLQNRYGATTCTVVNTAITATNSNIVVPIAKECSRLSPDIFIVYLGNNEVIGPFGPGTVFSHFSPRWLIKLRIFLSSTRLGQLAAAFSRSVIKSTGTPAGWGGMSMLLQHKIRFDDPRMRSVYQNYQDNLREICRAARRSKTRVVLCTVASNLKDCAPFFSMHRPDLSPNTLKQWEHYYQQAVNLQSKKRFAEALALLKKAELLDSTHAGMQYQIAKNLISLGQFDQAKQQFIAARDYDALRFRADSHLNKIVRDVAHEFTDCAVLLDADKQLSAASEHGICGDTLFLEHVHYNFHGNYLLAASMLPLLDSLMGLPVADAPPISEEACKKQLAFNPWEELVLDRAIYHRFKKPPFSDQAENHHRVALYKEKITLLSTFVADSGQSILASYQHAAPIEPKRWRIADLFGRYLLLNNGNTDAMKQAFRTVLAALPHNQFVWYNLAIILERQDKREEAIEYYSEAIRIDPLFFESYVNLVDNLMAESRTNEAMKFCKKVLRVNPGLTSAQERYAQLLLMQRKNRAAALRYDKTIIAPDALAIIYNKMGLRLLNHGYQQDALEQFTCAVTVNPELAEAQNNLGGVLVKVGKLSEGIAHFKEAIRINATQPEVRINFADALRSQGSLGEAEKQYRAALSLNPNMAPALNGLGLLLVNQDRLPQAIDLFVRAIEKQPSMLAAHQNLISTCILMNQQKRAMEILARLAKQYPQTAEIHLSLGKLLLEQGNRVDAKRELLVAAQQRPNLPEIGRLLAAMASSATSRMFPTIANCVNPCAPDCAVRR